HPRVHVHRERRLGTHHVEELPHPDTTINQLVPLLAGQGLRLPQGLSVQLGLVQHGVRTLASLVVLVEVVRRVLDPRRHTLSTEATTRTVRGDQLVQPRLLRHVGGPRGAADDLTVRNGDEATEARHQRVLTLERDVERRARDADLSSTAPVLHPVAHRPRHTPHNRTHVRVRHLALDRRTDLTRQRVVLVHLTVVPDVVAVLVHDVGASEHVRQLL